MDSDQGKLFIGGISSETTEEKLKDYFGQYGDVLQTVVMRDKISGKPRGFGFVVFSDPNLLETVLLDTHVIDGRTVEAKRALSREEQQISKAGNPSSGRSFGGGGGGGGGGIARTKKIFVGGLLPTLTDDDFRQYFETYGNVTDVAIMFDQQTNRPRGFGFISFDSEDAVERVLHKAFHDLNGKQVEVKRAFPKDANPSGSGRSMGGGGAGGYQVYGASSGNSNSYESLMDSNRYMQSQNTGGGYPPYGSSGYNAAGYGYGPPNSGMSYGGANPGYGGPAAAAYGNPNVSSAGYGSAPPGAPRNTWNTQGSGYGDTGYANAPWGAPNTSGSGPGSGGAVGGHSPSGAAGYGNQGYGYGGYGLGAGAYGNPAAYGTAGGCAGSNPTSNAAVGGNGADLQAGSGGYIGGGYGDAAGYSGYGNPGWSSDPSQTSNYGAHLNGLHGGQVGYGGAYGGAPTHQAQQQ